MEYFSVNVRIGREQMASSERPFPDALRDVALSRLKQSARDQIVGITMETEAYCCSDVGEAEAFTGRLAKFPFDMANYLPRPRMLTSYL